MMELGAVDLGVVVITQAIVTEILSVRLPLALIPFYAPGWRFTLHSMKSSHPNSRISALDPVPG
jgi:hypothetical protein